MCLYCAFFYSILLSYCRFDFHLRLFEFSFSVPFVSFAMIAFYFVHSIVLSSRLILHFSHYFNSNAYHPLQVSTLTCSCMIVTWDCLLSQYVFDGVQVHIIYVCCKMKNLIIVVVHGEGRVKVLEFQSNDRNDLELCNTQSLPCFFQWILDVRFL